MPAATSGLARITIRAPRRRLDLAVPDQVPLAEILPEVLRRAGEAAGDLGPAPGGWTLRRADGVALGGATALSAQGVLDGDVLYLVPRNVTWPEPDYDDVVEEIAANARRRGRSWDATATRLVALAAAGLVLAAGLAALFTAGPMWSVPAALALGVAAVLLGAGLLLSRAVGDAAAGATAGGFALPYAAAGAALATGGAAPLSRLGPAALLLGGMTLLFASVLGAVAVGHGLRIFVAGGTVGAGCAAGALLATTVSPAGAAAILVVAFVAGIGVVPAAAVRLGRLPLPVLAGPGPVEPAARPERSMVEAAVVRADEVLLGGLLGIAVVGAAGVAVLALSGGLAANLLGALAGVALLLRARLFPTVAARLPLLGAGLLGLAVAGSAGLAATGPAARLVAVASALGAVAVLLGIATAAYRRRAGSPYPARLADVLDVVTVIALAPVACAVLDLYARMRGLAG
ncbi:MAG: type VII secretion integral membrane protein EccD [Micromonosporaceae bacterium]